MAASNTRTTVHHLINTFDAGGTERQAVQLVNALERSRRWSVLVDSMHLDGPMRDALRDDLRAASRSFPLRRFASLHTVRELTRLASRLRQERVSIVHTHGLYANVFGMAAAALAGVPVRIASKRESSALRQPALARLEQVAFSLATHVLVNCEAIRRELMAAGMREASISVIYNAVDEARGREGASASSPDPAVSRVPPVGADDHCSVVMVANFHHRAKDHATFLRAAARTVAVAPRTRFVLAGDGPLRAQTEAYAREMGLGAHVTFVGRSDDVPSLLASADVGVLSSRLEGFPNVVLEYMAAARPVVTTDAGGVREAVEDGLTGRVVPVGDDAALAHAMLELLADPARRIQMGEAGQARVREVFTLERQLRDVERLYTAELRRRRAISP